MTKVIGGTESGKLKAVASGTLSNGDTVIVNSDGTVSAVAETSVSSSAGSAVVFDTGYTEVLSATFDSNAGKVVIAFKDGSSSYGTAIVGTVSGSSISFGTPAVFNSGNTTYISATFDSSLNKVVISYQDNSNSQYGTTVIGTVSGTSISFGTPVVFNSAETAPYSTFDSSSNKVVTAYSNYGASRRGEAKVGTVSGTSISYGSATVFESGITTYINPLFDSSNNKIVIAYADGSNSSYGTAIVGTVSGTSISFGSPVVFNSATSVYTSAVIDGTANKVVISYSDYGNSQSGTAIVGTVSGTSITFGTSVVFNAAGTYYMSSAFDSNANRVAIGAYDVTSTDSRFYVGTVSGTSISFDTPVVFDTDIANPQVAVFDNSNNKVVVSYADYGNSRQATSVVFQVGYTSINITAENYIGISSTTVADTETATIDIIGTTNNAQSGLTAGQKYYVQNDGTLSTTADAPSVLAGTALSATKLVVKT